MVDYEVLRDKGNFVSLTDNEFISCDGLDHVLKFIDQGHNQTPAGFDFPSNVVDGAEIYVLRSIRGEFKRALLVHELTEFSYLHEVFGEDLRMPGIINNRILKEEMVKAHNLAKRFDDMYAKESFDSRTYSEYNQFKNDILNRY